MASSPLKAFQPSAYAFRAPASLKGDVEKSALETKVSAFSSLVTFVKYPASLIVSRTLIASFVPSLEISAS
ncbi:hypothetical protein D3C77_445200 [compost metagenome]